MATGRRRHHFWECVVALSLRDELVEAMGGAVVLLPQHLWLGRPPLGMHPLVWDVVCLAAVAALGLGLRLLFRVQAGAPGGRMPVVRVCAVVTADFWARLSAFAELGLAPRGWGAVPSDHPFLAASPAGEVVFPGRPGAEDLPDG